MSNKHYFIQKLRRNYPNKNSFNLALDRIVQNTDIQVKENTRFVRVGGGTEREKQRYRDVGEERRGRILAVAYKVFFSGCTNKLFKYQNDI